MKYDVIIIGAGPSGVTLAVYLKRASINPLVIYKDGGSLGYAKIENFYSYDKIDGKELFERGLSQLKANNIDVIKGEVLNVIQELDYKVLLENSEYHSDYLVIATGLNKTSISSK